MLIRSLAVFLCAASLFGAELSGKWKGQIEGTDRDTILVLKMDGSSITGTMSDPEGKDRPLKGKLEGDAISLIVDSEWQGNPVKLSLKGTLAGDQMNLTVSSENGEWSAGLTAKKE